MGNTHYSPGVFTRCIVRPVALTHALLGFLAAGPAHGYDLKRAYDQRFASAKSLAYGQVYASLARMQRDELVEVVETSQEGGPERTTYALTEQGEQTLRAWLAAVEPPGPYPAEDLVRKTVTALYLGVDATGVLARQRASHLAVMRNLVTLQREAREPSARIVIDYLIFHLDADLRWLEAAAGHLRLAGQEQP